MDFNISKESEGFCYSYCGSQDYLAPEVIMRKGYNKTVDFYSLGKICYQMLEG